MKKIIIMLLAMVMAIAVFAAQCAATTKKGGRCKRQAAAGSAYCWQHGGKSSSPSHTTAYPRAAVKQNPSADGEAQKVPKPEPDGKIHTLFGIEVGDLLVNYDKAKKLVNKQYYVKETMELSPPFSVCKNVTLYYTANKRRLYKMIFSSDVYLNPNDAKIKERMAEMSKDIGAQFKEVLTMESRPFGYVANFKGNVEQKLSVSMVSESGGANKKKIVITLVDKEVELD